MPDNSGDSAATTMPFCNEKAQLGIRGLNTAGAPGACSCEACIYLLMHCSPPPANTNDKYAATVQSDGTIKFCSNTALNITRQAFTTSSPGFKIKHFYLRFLLPRGD